MAKAFSDQERVFIQKKLRNVATEYLGKTGIRKTTVDELASAAGISKGAFYLFYETKEELFFEVIIQYHEKVEAELVKQLEELTEPTEQEIVAILLRLFREVNSSFFPKFLVGGEVELLMRRVPPEKHSMHMQNDTAMVTRIVNKISGIDPALADMYAASFRAVFLLVLHRDEIGAAYFDSVLEILISGIVHRMFSSASNGSSDR